MIRFSAIRIAARIPKRRPRTVLAFLESEKWPVEF